MEPSEFESIMHTNLFCGCVPTEVFQAPLSYMIKTLEEGEAINHEELGKLMNGPQAAYLLLTMLNDGDVLTHGSSIRTCWLEEPGKIEYLKGLLLECTGVVCPWCNREADVCYPENKASLYCQVCKQMIDLKGRKKYAG